MRRLLTLSALVPLCFAFQLSMAKDPVLAPGSKAPPLKVSQWLKGEPVTNPNKGVVVVEFWATWCGPCRESIPHLTEMAKSHKTVAFIGVDAFEHGTPIETVQKFVKDMGDKMDYHVAADDKDFMADNWMKAAKQPGIPTAFIVKDGVIQWIGHPMEMEKPLDEIVANKFDLATFQKSYTESQKQQEAQAKVRDQFNKVHQLLTEGNGKEAIAALDAFAKDLDENTKPIAEAYRTVGNALINPEKGKSEIDAQLAAGKYETVAQTLELFPPKNPTATYAAQKLLAGDGAKSVIADYSVAMFGIQSKDKALAIAALDAADKALPNSQYKDSDQIKQMFAQMRKQAEAIQP